MGIVLGPRQYGTPETRVVRFHRDMDRHETGDLNVSSALALGRHGHDVEPAGRAWDTIPGFL